MNLKIRSNSTPNATANHIIADGILKYRQHMLGIQAGGYQLRGAEGEHMVYLSRTVEGESLPTVWFCGETELCFYIVENTVKGATCPHCHSLLSKYGGTE
ncbi:MAG: hypothetical protein KAS32_04245 [Candidatus Peribacteraceae bacterium]|nr:hypothetical protein [Candidatus Peribacteraceae bacterium]